MEYMTSFSFPNVFFSFFPLIILVYWRKTLSKSVIRFLSAKVPLCKVMHNHSGHDHCHAAPETSCTCEVVTS